MEKHPVDNHGDVVIVLPCYLTYHHMEDTQPLYKPHNIHICLETQSRHVYMCIFACTPCVLFICQSYTGFGQDIIITELYNKSLNKGLCNDLEAQVIRHWSQHNS